MLMAFPFFANRPFIAPLNLNGLLGFCKPQCAIGPPWKKPRKWSAKGPLPEAAIGRLFGELRKCTPLPPRPKATRLTLCGHRVDRPRIVAAAAVFRCTGVWYRLGRHHRRSADSAALLGSERLQGVLTPGGEPPSATTR
jgi:hypothetical protein